MSVWWDLSYNKFFTCLRKHSWVMHIRKALSGAMRKWAVEILLVGENAKNTMMPVQHWCRATMMCNNLHDMRTHSSCLIWLTFSWGDLVTMLAFPGLNHWTQWCLFKPLTPECDPRPVLPCPALSCLFGEIDFAAYLLVCREGWYLDLTWNNSFWCSKTGVGAPTSDVIGHSHPI